MNNFSQNFATCFEDIIAAKGGNYVFKIILPIIDSQ